MKQKLWKVYAVIFLVVVCIPEIYGVIDTYSPINFLYAMYTSVFFGLVYIYAFTKIKLNRIVTKVFFTFSAICIFYYLSGGSINLSGIIVFLLIMLLYVPGLLAISRLSRGLSNAF